MSNPLLCLLAALPTFILTQNRAAQAAAKSLQAMNPLVQVTSAPGSIEEAAAAGAGGAESSGVLAQQDLVIATGLPLHKVR